MSSFYPRCVASNQDAVYALSTVYIRDTQHFVLVKSANGPTSYFSAEWEVIAISSVDDVDPYNTNLFQTLVSNECSVDNDGTFSMWARENNDFIVFKFVHSSQGTLSSSNKCKKNNPRGQWTKSQVDMPFRYAYKRWASVQDPSSTAGATTVVVHTRTEEALPPIAPPTIYYTPVNTTSPRTYFDTLDLTPIVLTNTSAAIVNLVYGDNQMFALLKSGAPIPVPTHYFSMDNVRVTYNKTLTYFPFPPKNQTDTPQVVSVPWNVACADNELWDENYARVANGKLYYLCRASNDHAAPVNLHIHDTKTSQTKTIQIDSYDPDKFVLAYGPSSKTDPQFLTVFGTSICSLDLFKNETIMEYPRYTTLPNDYRINERCGTLDRELTSWEYVMTVICALVGLALLAWGWRRWRNKRAPKPTVEEGRPPGYDQSVSSETHIELAEMQRASEEGRVEAPPVYVPRS